jgi:hypothetical protein
LFAFSTKKEIEMYPTKPDANYSRETFARTSEEVPFFPFEHVRMTQSTANPADNIEEAQYEFVKQAGMPWHAPEDERED